MRRVFLGVAVLILGCASFARASATLLLEEPYGKLGFFTATGHAAVYLSGVCADTPLVLRRCAPGETGIVLARYNGVAGYDWIAIPLIPYLYAVERPEDVPLFANAKMVSFLRDRYRRNYLQDIAPDAKNGQAPGGNWYELVGTSYDRTVYGFEIETTPKQDDALIQKLNSSANRSHFRTVSNNCADFAKDVINFYYPRSLHRSVVADAGITTPKQMAKMITKFSARHPELHSSRLVIAQVPGSMPRSSTVHGVVESFFTSKKYIVPSAVVSPIFAGCVAAVYVGTGAGHFEPARNAMVYVVGSDPEPPLGREDRRALQEQFKHYMAGVYPENGWPECGQSMGEAAIQGCLRFRRTRPAGSAGAGWRQPGSDRRLCRQCVKRQRITAVGAPVARSAVAVGVAPQIDAGVSETEIDRDWKLLQQTDAAAKQHG